MHRRCRQLAVHAIGIEDMIMVVHTDVGANQGMLTHEHGFCRDDAGVSIEKDVRANPEFGSGFRLQKRALAQVDPGAQVDM